jgi:hypothetical protein
LDSIFKMEWSLLFSLNTIKVSRYYMQLKADCLKQIGSNWHSDWTSVLVIYGATSSLLDHHILQSRCLASWTVARLLLKWKERIVPIFWISFSNFKNGLTHWARYSLEMDGIKLVFSLNVIKVSRY